MRDHGGNLDGAMAVFGGTAADWIDLSTGINRVPYPVPPILPEAWATLPRRSALDALGRAAQAHYGTTAPVLPVAGAQAAIQMIPWIDGARGAARVLGPTYNEHAATLRHAGWQVAEVGTLAALSGADLAVVVNPNNPDGQRHAPEALLALRGSVGRLVVDESFGDVDPELSLLAAAGRPGLLILRSLGKFWGLAGVRLGFVFGSAADIAALSALSGPWPVSGAALTIGAAALQDRVWAEITRARLQAEIARMDGLAAQAGWQVAGGTALFRLYHTPDAPAAQRHLGRARIWSRVFPWHAHWLRLGMPGPPAEWARLAVACGAVP